MRVVFLILDGLPDRHVGASVTPTLAGLAAEGWRSTGTAVLTSATYPNHATFATGIGPGGHGIWANWIAPGGHLQPAQHVGPAVGTLAAAAPSCAAVVGDQNLVGVMGLSAADVHWPPGGNVPEGAPLDGHGYLTDADVVPRLVEALADGHDLVIGHLNGPDTAGHVHGPDSPEALDGYRETDAALAAVLEAVRPRWDESVVIVVSDHDMETLEGDPVDLYALDPAVMVIPEGTAAMAWGDDPSGGRWLDGIDGVAGHREVAPGARLVWGAPARSFALPPGFEMEPDLGSHGGMGTRTQVAVVAGGHPAARSLPAGPVAAEDWAPTIAALLGFDLPDATGRSLVV